jgi:hypothetical protein
MVLLLAWLGLAHADTLPPAMAYDAWSVVEVDAAPVGSVHAISTVLGDGGQGLRMRMEMSMLRAGTELRWSMEVTSEEGPDGAPRYIRVEQAQGALPMVSTLTFVDGEVIFVASSGDRTLPEVRQPIEPGCTGPGATERALAQALAAGQTTLSTCFYDGVLGAAPTRSTYTVLGAEQDGAERLWHVRVASSAAPGADYESWVDARGLSQRMVQPIGGFVMTIRESDGPPENVHPPELFLSTLVTPSKPIRAPRSAVYGQYVLRPQEGGPGVVMSVGAQSARTLPDGGVEVTVDTRRRAAAKPEEEAASLGRSTWIDPQDPATAALAAEAAGSVEGAAAKAEALRRLVYRHIVHKDLGTGFGTSAEVVASQSGDCTEHAVLLAALLRSQGIGSRVVSGLVYVPGLGPKGAFGYHMWTQALLPGAGGLEWTDLDATLPGEAFDATHIALGVSTLDDDRGQRDMAGMTPMIGNLEIDVRKVR